MSEIIEFTENDGRKLLINVDHIIKIQPDENGVFIYFDVATGGKDSVSLHCIHIKDSYSSVKRKLGL